MCSRLEVISQTVGESIGTLTSLAEADIQGAQGMIPQVHVEESNRAAPRGTLVIGHLRDVPKIQDLRAYLLDSVQFAKEQVYFNPGFPIWTSADERRRPFCVV